MRKIWIAIICITSIVTHAQNSRLSQLQNASIMVNPALAGRFQGNLRAGSLLSWQNSKIASVAHQNFYVETKLFNKQQVKEDSGQFIIEKEKSYFGINLNHYRYGTDITGFMQNSTPINASFTSLTGAMHINLTKDGRYYFGVGLQLTNADASLDETRGTAYDTEISGGGFRYRKTASENFKSSKGYFEYSVGANVGYQTDEHLLEMGIAMYHMNQPENDLNGDPDSKLRRRLTAYTNAMFKLSENKQLVFRNIYWEEGLYQASTTYKDSAYIIAFYSGLEWINTKPTSKYFANWGVHTRNFQTIIPQVNVHLGNYFTTRLSYEVPLNNSIHPANNAYRTELFVGYTLGLNSKVIFTKHRKNIMW